MDEIIEKNVLERVLTLQKIQKQRQYPTKIPSCFCIKTKLLQYTIPITNNITNNEPIYRLFGQIADLDNALVNSFITDVLDSSPRTDVTITEFNNIKTVLHAYQINNVNWMINIEKRLNLLDENLRKVTRNGNTVNIPLLKGGGLFDEVGMGKTLQTITLINSNKSTYNSFYKSNKLYSKATLLIIPNHLCKQWSREFEKHQKETLTIIELLTKAHYKKFSYYELMTADVVIVSSNFFINCELDPYEKTNRLFDITNIFEKRVNIFNIYWYRVAIDEFHEMEKNALFQLIKSIESDNRWIISGTPLKEHTIDEDIYTDDQVIGMGRRNEHWKKNTLNSSSIGQIINYLSWDASAILKYDFSNINHYNYLLSHFSRNMQSNNINILKLPTIREKVVWLNFSNTERMMYNAHLANGNNDMQDVFLRQMCCHPMLCEKIKEIVAEEGKTFSLADMQIKIKNMYLKEYEHAKELVDECSARIVRIEGEMKEMRDKGKTDLMGYADLTVSLNRNKENLPELEKTMKGKRETLEYYINFIELLKDTSKIMSQECPICLDNIRLDDIGISSCTHMFCYTCIHTIITTSQSQACPICNKHLKLNNIFSVSNQVEKEVEKEKEKAQTDFDVDKYGTKLAYLINYIKSTPTKYRIIYSQWDGMLREIGKVLDECGIKNLFCMGHVYQKDKVLKLFNSDAETNEYRVIMLSSNNNISGSNLTNAEEVIFIDPFYASRQERANMKNQAIGRVRRLGNKHKFVDVIELLVKNTVEENIYRHNCTEDMVEVKM